MLVLCAGIHGFSIVVNALGGAHEPSRILAACNTFAITCVGLAFYHYYSEVVPDREKVEKYMFRNMNTLLALCLLYWLVGDKGNLPVIGTLSAWDFVDGVDTTRFAGYLEYANLTVFVYLYCWAFSVHYLSARCPRVVSLVLEILYVLPLAAARSRLGVACGAALILVSIVLVKIPPITELYLRHKKKIWAIGIAGVMLVCLVCFRPLWGMVWRVLSYREGSTQTRTAIYGMSLQKMLTQSPIWGCGIKDMIPVWNYPYGSHSTYIGMFYKIGILGGSLYLLATILAVWNILRREETDCFDILISFAFLALFAVAMLEDLDGANWSFVMFMSLLGAFVRPQRKK